jgi:hypothetical protein
MRLGVTTLRGSNPRSSAASTWEHVKLTRAPVVVLIVIATSDWHTLGMARDERGDRDSRGLGQLLGHLGVDVHRERGGAVPQRLADDLRRLARGEEHRRRAMPEVMQPDRREAEPRHHRGKVLGDAARAQRRPVLAGELAPAVGPRARPRHALGELGLAGPQCARGAFVNLDDPLGVLALGGVELVVDLGLPDVDAAAREVDVALAQPAQLRPAQPVIGGHGEQRVHPVVLDAIEEGAAVIPPPDQPAAGCLTAFPPPLDAGHGPQQRLDLAGLAHLPADAGGRVDCEPCSP